MRISDWSSDVCSSDLHRAAAQGRFQPRARHVEHDPARTDIGLCRGRGQQLSGRAARLQGGGKGLVQPRLFGPRQLRRARAWRYGTDARSEEHTSELQSLMRISYAVFCLKKKKNIKYKYK